MKLLKKFHWKNNNKQAQMGLFWSNNMRITVTVTILLALALFLSSCSNKVVKCSKLNFAERAVHEMIFPICNSY